MDSVYNDPNDPPWTEQKVSITCGQERQPQGKERGGRIGGDRYGQDGEGWRSTLLENLEKGVDSANRQLFLLGVQ